MGRDGTRYPPPSVRYPALLLLASLAACGTPDTQALQAAIEQAAFRRDSMIAAIQAYQEAERPYWEPVSIDRPTIAIFAPRPKTAGDPVPDAAIRAITLAAAVDSVANAHGVIIVVRATERLRFSARSVIILESGLGVPEGASGIALAGPRHALAIRLELPEVPELIAVIEQLDSLHRASPRETRAT